jgi:disulfide bond formation protein DsbB
MEFGIRILLLLAAAVFFLIAIFSDTNWPDFIAVGLLLVSIAMIVEATPLGKMRWNTTGAGTRRE